MTTETVTTDPKDSIEEGRCFVLSALDILEDEFDSLSGKGAGAVYLLRMAAGKLEATEHL